MKRTTGVVLLTCVAVLALTSLAMATESTKDAAAWSGTQVVPAVAATAEANAWTTVLAGSLKTGAPKDIAVLFTAETMLGTYVKVHTKKDAEGLLEVDTDSSEAAILVRCLVDDVEAYPGPVTFDSRLVKLSAFLGEAIYTDPGTGELLSAGDQWISIYERTKAAHAFCFCLDDLGSGEHVVEIQAQIVLSPSPHEVNPEVTEAYIGARMMVCDEINLKSRLYPQ
jgi:hypothetical protein